MVSMTTWFSNASITLFQNSKITCFKIILVALARNKHKFDTASMLAHLQKVERQAIAELLKLQTQFESIRIAMIDQPHVNPKLAATFKICPTQECFEALLRLRMQKQTLEQKQLENQTHKKLL